MYNLSKSGQRDIQIQKVSGGQGGGYRRVLSTSKWFSQYRIGSIPNSTLLVGNKVVCFFVSPLYVQMLSCYIQLYTVQERPSPSSGVFSMHLENGLDVDSGGETEIAG